MSRRDELIVSGFGFAIGLAWLLGLYFAFFPSTLNGGAPLMDLSYLGYDIDVFVDAAVRFAETGSLYASEQVEAPFMPGQGQFFYYAPPFGLALAPVSGLGEIAAYGTWYWLKVAALVLACVLMPVRPPVRALTFLGVAVSYWAMKDLVLGNVGVLLLLPLVGAWRWLDRPLGSIAAAIAITIRPTYGAILIWQLIRRRWKVAAWTVGSGLAIIALSLPFVGLDGYLDYLSVLGNLQSPIAGSNSRDLGGMAVLLGVDPAWMGALRLLSLVLGLVLIVLSLRKDPELSFAITITASLLLVGQLWDFYLLSLALPLALLADRWRPVALLVLVLSWTPSVVATALLVVTLSLLFVLPTTPRTDSPLSEPDAEGLPA